MWWPRLWYLLTFVGGAVLLAGALTLPGFRDADLAAARAASVTLEAELLRARISARVADQGRVAQALAVNPKLTAALDTLTDELPPHVREAQLSGAMKALAEGNVGLGIVLVGADQEVLSATVSDPGFTAAAAHAAARRAVRGQFATARIAGRFVFAATVPGTDGSRGALLVTAPAPHIIAAQSHADRDGLTRLVVRSPAGVFSELEKDDRTRLLEAGEPEAEPPGEVALSDGRYAARVFSAPHDVELVLAWRTAAPTTLGVIGGIGAVWSRGTATDQLGLVLAAAGALWLVGALLGLAILRAGVGALVRQIDDLASGSSLDPVDAGRLPAWLRAAAGPLNEAATGAQRIALTRAEPAPAVEVTRSEVEPSPGPETPPPTVATQPKAPPHVPPPERDETSPLPPGLAAAPALMTVPRDSGAPSVIAPIGDDASPSFLDVSLPALDEEDEPEPEDYTDSDIRLPGSGKPEPQPPSGGSLLAALRDQGALEPERRRPPPGKKSGDDTVVRGVTLEQLAAARGNDNTAVGPPPERPGETLDRYFREVFDELVATKAGCGESIETLDFKRFRAKLDRTRKTLIDRFKCHDVRFRVHVKDGKAALKAAPVLHPEDP